MSEEVDLDSAFHDQNVLPSILIMLSRLYDVQIALLGAVDSEAAMVLARGHEAGQIMAPPPSFAPPDVS